MNVFSIQINMFRSLNVNEQVHFIICPIILVSKYMIIAPLGFTFIVQSSLVIPFLKYSCHIGNVTTSYHFYFIQAILLKVQKIIYDKQNTLLDFNIVMT